ncbi:MAG: glycosyltransferase [bacterium]|nr:glycosyltransferase [bacterium]
MQDIITPHNLYWVLGEQELGPLEFYFARALEANGKKVCYINIHKLYSQNWKKFSGYSHRFPRKYDNSIQKKYLKLINDSLIERYHTEKPSHIFIYNDCKVLPQTLELFKRNGTNVTVFLGDDPNYLLPAKKTFLLTVINADAVIVPDSGWIEGLKLLDVKKIIFSPVGTDAKVFFPLTPDANDISKYGADILFVGTGYYLNSWGIKRATLLNELSGLDFKLFGDNQWLELLTYFPALKKNFVNEMLTSAEVNTACNCSKIYPVVVNDGVTNGVSTRIFDCIASGIFVLAEYKKDIDTFFPGNEVVTFKSKSELKEKAEYFLKNENERKDHIEKARKKVLENYTLDILVKNILEQI